MYPIAKAVGSSRDVLGVYAAGADTVPLGAGLGRGFLESTPEGETTDQSDA